CTLDHPVADSRNRQAACSAVRLRYSYGSYPQRSICSLLQLLAKLVKKTFYTFGFDRFERHSIYTRSAVVQLRQPISFKKRFPLADVHIQTPKAPRRFSLRLDV